MKEHFYTFIFAMAFVFFYGLSVMAYDFEYDNLYYNVISEYERTVEVTNDGYFSYKYAGDIVIPPTVVNDGNTYTVVSIGSSAFSMCSDLTSIEIPGSVKSMGNNAFYMCENLTSVDIPSGVISIGDFAFSGCHGLVSVKISDSVASIGDYAFFSCIYNHRTTKTNQKYPSVNL